MTKPFTPLTDALREPLPLGSTFAAVLGPMYGYGLTAALMAMPLREVSQAELDQPLVDDAVAELATGKHTVH